VSSDAMFSGASGTIAFRSPVAGATSTQVWTRPDGRRMLQLGLAAIWLLDGILQLQAYFFTKAFGTQFIPAVAQGNPSIIARPINWSGATIAHHALVADAMFAVIQIAIGFGIAWRPTLKVALGTSIAWALGVWWMGEGLGGVLNGVANPVNGAPGAVMIYALLAVLLWPRDHSGPTPSFVAARTVGEPVAKALWLVLWGSLSYFAVLGSNRSPQGLYDMIAGMASGEPGWLSRIDKHAASLVNHQGSAVTVVLAILLGMIAIGVYLPAPVTNALLAVGMVLSFLFWVLGEAFGTLFTASGTDLNSGPLLILLSVAYWKYTSSSESVPNPNSDLVSQGA